MQQGGHHVHALDALAAADQLRAQQAARAFLGGEAHVNGTGVEVVPGVVGAAHVHTDGLQPQVIRFRLRDARSGRTQPEEFEDGGGDNARKVRFPARHVHPGHAPHAVGGQAQRHVNFAPGDAVGALAVVASSVNARHAGFLAVVHGNGPGLPDSCARRLCQFHVGFHAHRHDHRVRPHQPGVRLHARHAPGLSGQPLHRHARPDVHAVLFQFVLHTFSVPGVQGAARDVRRSLQHHHAQAS